MGELHIQVRTLRNRRPILLSWFNIENKVMECCLVTCVCQGYKLNEDCTDERENALKLSQAMERAEVVSFYREVNLTGLVQSDVDANLETEDDAVMHKIRRRHRRGKSKPAKNAQLSGDEDFEKHIGESKEEEEAEEEDATEEGLEGVSKFKMKEDYNRDEEADVERDPELVEDDDDTSRSLSQEEERGKNANPDSSTTETVNSDDDKGNATTVKAKALVEPLSEKLERTVAGEQNVGNTVEVGADCQTEENPSPVRVSLANHPKTISTVPGDSTENPFLTSSLGLPASSTVTLTDVEGNTYMNVQGVGVLEAGDHGTMVSGATGTSYITMLSNAQQNSLSAEQEQALLKTLEGFISATAGEEGVLNESLRMMANATPGPPEADRYTVKVILGEAEGPLNKKDQARMDKYRQFKSHKDAEFHRKYHKYQNMKGVNFVLCEVCGAPLNNKNVKHHMTALHQAPEERERNFICNVCGRAFLCASNLQRHMDTHSGIRYKCSYCPKSYSQDHSRKLHEKGHFGETKRTLRNPFAGMDDVENTNSEEKSIAFLYCELCYKRLRPQSLRGHMSIHRNEYFTCSVCQKVLRISGKREHMLRHTSEKKFVCTVCSKRFVSKGSLEAHMRVHTQERPYKCKFCSETFKTSHTRNTHQRIHTGEKPYSCSKCNKSWRDRTTYWGHMKKHHPGEPLMYIRKSLQIQAARDAGKYKGDGETAEPAQDEMHIQHGGLQPTGDIEVQEVIQVDGGEPRMEDVLQGQVTSQPEETIQSGGALQNPTVIHLQDGLQIQEGIEVNGGMHVQGHIQNPAVIQLQGGIPVHGGMQTQGNVQVQNIIQVEDGTHVSTSMESQGVKVEEEVPHIISLTLVTPTMDS